MAQTPSSSSSTMPRPVLREVYLNRDVSSRYGKQRPGTEQCERNVLIQNTSTFPENITPKTIGNPETNGFHKSPENVFQKSFRLFRESRASRSSIFKSKSEGNIKELIDEEPRPSLVQSLYRGFSSSMNFRYSEQQPPETNKPSSCFLSLGAEVNTLTRNQRSVSQLRRQDTQIKSLPYLPPSQASLFSCFTAGPGNGLNKPAMSNHRNFMRPRDIKVVVSSIKLSWILTTWNIWGCGPANGFVHTSCIKCRDIKCHESGMDNNIDDGNKLFLMIHKCVFRIRIWENPKFLCKPLQLMDVIIHPIR